MFLAALLPLLPALLILLAAGGGDDPSGPWPRI